jgi:ElaB/YqjD/DUF883 family membrane-anchored ribosome-binding protein
MNMDNLIDRDARDQLLADFKVVISDAEALLKATAHNGGAEMTELRQKVEASLGVAKGRMREAQADLVARGKEAATAADEYIHANPWQAVGVAAGVGLLIGLLTQRR